MKIGKYFKNGGGSKAKKVDEAGSVSTVSKVKVVTVLEPEPARAVVEPAPEATPTAELAPPTTSELGLGLEFPAASAGVATIGSSGSSKQHTINTEVAEPTPEVRDESTKSTKKAFDTLFANFSSSGAKGKNEELATDTTLEVRDEAEVIVENVVSESDDAEDAETFEEGDEVTYEGSILSDDKSEMTSEQQFPQLNHIMSDKSFTTTAMENDVTAKYFHKDVVVNSLEEGSNSLVIRAMYFIPRPNAEDHVVVKIEACTICCRDIMCCKGHGLTKQMLPYVPGYNIIGTIQILGDDIKLDGNLRKGDRVAGISTFGGGNSRFISIPANRLTKISSKVKSTLAVCLVHDYMAALKTLRLARKNGSPFTGINMLLTDGFSPIGQAIIALAALEGMNVYCCADESKHSYLASLGAKCFEKHPDLWLPSVVNTFDVVVDSTCVDGYASSWEALNKNGTLICLGPIFNIDLESLEQPRGGCGVMEVSEMQHKWAELKAKYVMSRTHFLNTDTVFDEDTPQYRQDLKYLLFLCEKGDIKPKIAERVSLDDVPDAQRLMQVGKANGTVVCVPWIEE